MYDIKRVAHETLDGLTTAASTAAIVAEMGIKGRHKLGETHPLAIYMSRKTGHRFFLMEAPRRSGYTKPVSLLVCPELNFVVSLDDWPCAMEFYHRFREGRFPGLIEA